jgi:DnaJ-class molecular chaperone
MNGNGTKRAFYEVLGIPENATRGEATAAYKQLALQCHPDRSRNPDAEERFKEISQAYAEARAVLPDGPEPIYEERESVLRHEEPKFRSSQRIFREGTGTKRDVKISLEEAGTGTTRNITVVCDLYKGKAAENKHICERCQGRECVQTIPLRIPAGIESGMQLMLPEIGAFSGGVLVKVTVKPHKVFERHRDNIYCELHVTASQLRSGAEIEVPTLDGSTLIRLPQNTKRHTIICLQGMGLPEYGGTRRGSLMVKLV